MPVIESSSMYGPGMVDTEVTIDVTTFGLQSKTWVIQEKISESAHHWTKRDAEMQYGPPYAAGKFRCFDKSDPTGKLAFMRIYHQLPVAGTEWAPLSVRAEQAIQHQSFPELEAFKTFKMEDCSDVPQLLGYHIGQQPDDGIAPGGFTTTLVWETVPGSPLSSRSFWSYDRAERDLIRQEFRSVFDRVIGCGIYPSTLHGEGGIQKVIYERRTGKIKIAGFRGFYPKEHTSFEPLDFVRFSLAKLPDRGNDGESDPSTWTY